MFNAQILGIVSNETITEFHLALLGGLPGMTYKLISFKGGKVEVHARYTETGEEEFYGYAVDMLKGDGIIVPEAVAALMSVW